MYLRVSLTDRCNLRCRYCLPERPRFAPERVAGERLRRLTELISRAVSVDKIRYTGGEPALVPDLDEHVALGARLTDGNVGLTSNGLLLAERLPALRDAGLRRLNISLDGVDEASFLRVTRRPGFGRVLGAIRRARALGFRPLKVNVVAMASTDYAGLVALAIREGVQLRFIELMAIGVARAEHATEYCAADAIRARLFDAGYSLFEQTELDEPTSRVWTLAGVAPERCSIGFITTSSDPFCATCDRIRLTSQGRLHTCLFDNSGTDLLEPWQRHGEAGVVAAVQTAVAAKAPPAHFVRYADMAAIGG